MNFVVNSKELGSFKTVFEKVVEFFFGLFMDKKIFQSKMLFTTVVISSIDLETHSEIECRQDGYVINIDINPSDSLDYIVYQFAHELSHLMLMPLMLNPCVSTGYSKVDESYAITTLTRKAGRVTYGISFEEAFCNWVALKAVNSIFKKDYINAKYVSKEEISIVDTIVNSFEIAPVSYWDSLTKDNYPANAFLFGVAYGDISYAIDCMDSIMGRASWKGLMHSTYVQMSDQSKKKEAMWQIKLSMKEFKKNFRNSMKVKEALTA